MRSKAFPAGWPAPRFSFQKNDAGAAPPHACCRKLEAQKHESHTERLRENVPQVAGDATWVDTYSTRNASTGFRWLARRAGSKHASKAASASTAAVAPSNTGLCADV